VEGKFYVLRDSLDLEEAEDANEYRALAELVITMSATTTW